METRNLQGCSYPAASGCYTNWTIADRDPFGLLASYSTGPSLHSSKRYYLNAVKNIGRHQERYRNIDSEDKGKGTTSYTGGAKSGMAV